MITCVVDYVIDPAKLPDFERFAAAWMRLVQREGGIHHGYLYNGGTYTAIDDPLGTNGTYAQGINDAGEIVGYYYDASGIGRA